MARPKAKELTERELELMHVFWEHGELTIGDVQQHLQAAGRPLAYTTVATLTRILCDKGFLVQTSKQRPHQFRPQRSFKDVSGRLVTDLVQRVFGGSREALLMRLMEQQRLSKSEREAIEQLIRSNDSKESGKR